MKTAAALLPLVAGLLLLSGVVVLGGLALRSLRDQPRYQIVFGDIECTPPPGLTREVFLEEVQMLASFPDSACALDDGLPARLSAAFAKHPWVEQVRGVEVAAPKRVRVRLAYRTAVLRVQAKDDDKVRAVDRFGVRLPDAAVDPSLPLLTGEVERPTGKEGRPWGDDRVETAARTAAFIAPYQDRLHLQNFETAADGVLTLSGPAVRVLWGRAPGSEPSGEAGAEAKLRRLLDFVAGHGDGGAELDVRPEDGR